MFNENGIVHHLGLTQSCAVQKAFAAAKILTCSVCILFFSLSMWECGSLFAKIFPMLNRVAFSFFGGN